MRSSWASRSRTPLPPMVIAWRAAHALVAIGFLASIGYVWWCAITRRRGPWLRRAVVALAGEGAVVAANHGDCPLGPMGDRIGDPVPLFELVLSPDVARRAIPVLGGVTAAGLGLLAVRSPGRSEGEILISRPMDEVFDFVADERNVYDPSVRRVEKLTPGPVGARTRFRVESRTMGRTVPMTVEIIEYERPARLRSSTTPPALRIEAALLFEPAPGGTRLRWRSDLRPSGPLKLLTPVMVAMGRRQQRSIWANLRRRLEDERQW